MNEEWINGVVFSVEFVLFNRYYGMKLEVLTAVTIKNWLLLLGLRLGSSILYCRLLPFHFPIFAIPPRYGQRPFTTTRREQIDSSTCLRAAPEQLSQPFGVADAWYSTGIRATRSTRPLSDLDMISIYASTPVYLLLSKYLQISGIC
jgi:hypothetical protein